MFEAEGRVEETPERRQLDIEAESPEHEGALAGRRILDLTGEMGSYCTKLLADMGADVIKIEPPGGDETRAIGPFVGDVPNRDRSLHFYHFNTNKRSITLDLESDDARPILRRLVESADVLVHTFSPKGAQKLDLGYEQLREINPGLVVTSVTGFGATGPYKHFQSNDLIGTAMGGLLAISGAPDSPPVVPYGSQGYHVASLYAAIATMCALQARNLTGTGQFVDVSMQESVASVLDLANIFYIYDKQVAQRMGTGHGLSAPARVYRCKDGEVVISGFNRELLEWMDREGMAGDLKDDDRWLFQEFRRQPHNRVHIDKLVERWALRHTKAELFEEGQRIRARTGLVLTAEELLECPQLVDRGFWIEVEDPATGAKLKDSGAPYKFSETPWCLRRRAPRLGEHNEEVYVHELGISPEELALLARAGVI